MNLEYRLIPHQKEDAAWHLALEEALFLLAKEKLKSGQPVQPIIRMYSFSKPSVILGYQQPIDEIDLLFCKANNIRVTMRQTGGGSVYLSPEELQYSLLLPQGYTVGLLRNINTSLSNAFQDVGFSPKIVDSNNHPVIEMNEKSFVFDAERRAIIFNSDKSRRDLTLHHGTVMVDSSYFDNDMTTALKANMDNKIDIAQGMLWLRDLQEIRAQALVKAFERNLPNGSKIVTKDFTVEELKLARQLYNDFYGNEAAISGGTKRFGICYLPSTQYDMTKYTRKDHNGL